MEISREAGAEELIRGVKALPDWKISIQLCTGSELVLNMKNRLNTVRFCPLEDERVFNSVTTDGFYLHFDVKPNYELDFNLREAVLMAMNQPPHTYVGVDPFDGAKW